MNADPSSSGPQSPQTPQPQGSPEAPAPAPGPQSPSSLQASSSTPQLSSVGKRFGAFCLEVVLSIVTLGIGWLIWTLIILGRGQTPAKQLLHMRVVRVDNGTTVSYGKMFVREFPAKIVIGFLAAFTIYIVYLWPLWDSKNQELWDKMVDTVVVEDPDDSLDPRQIAA